MESDSGEDGEKISGIEMFVLIQVRQSPFN